MKNGADLQGLEHGPDMIKILLIHAPGFISVPAERLNLVYPGEIVLEFSTQFTHFLLGHR